MTDAKKRNKTAPQQTTIPSKLNAKQFQIVCMLMHLSEDAGTRKAAEQILVRGKSLDWALAFTDTPKAPVLRSLRSMQSISESLSKLSHLPPPIGHAHFQLLASLMRQRQSSTTEAACLVLTQGMSVALASAQTSASRSSVFRQVKRMQQLLECSKMFQKKISATVNQKHSQPAIALHI